MRNLGPGAAGGDQRFWRSRSLSHILLQETIHTLIVFHNFIITQSIFTSSIFSNDRYYSDRIMHRCQRETEIILF